MGPDPGAAPGRSGNAPSGTLQGNVSLGNEALQEVSQSHGQLRPPTLLQTRGACRRPAQPSQAKSCRLWQAQGVQVLFASAVFWPTSRVVLRAVSWPVPLFTWYLCPAGALPARLLSCSHSVREDGGLSAARHVQQGEIVAGYPGTPLADPGRPLHRIERRSFHTDDR